MHRLFVALRPPIAVRDVLRTTMAGVPGARWQDDGQLHVTLRFIGEVDGTQAEEVALALAGMAGTAVEARLAGVGGFERDGGYDTLWAGLAPHAPLAALHAKVDRALVSAGVAPDRRAYLPHATVARLARRDGRHPAVREWLFAHATLASAPFRFDRYGLYESKLGRGGAHYREVAAWPLSLR